VLYKFFNSFWALQITGWLFYWLMICITFLSVLPPERSALLLFETKFVRALIGFALSCAMRAIYKRTVKAQNFGQAAGVSILCSVVFGFFWTYLSNGFYWSINDDFDFPGAHARAPRDTLDFSITLLTWSALYFGVKFWRCFQQERENALAAAALAERAQLEMLRYQLNPHFLFNALNSIRASIDEDSARAKQMITQLSEFLRFSLLNESAKKIPLRDEIEAVRNYLAIEKIRFEDKLTIEFAVAKEAENFRIPAFLLNPLVENAIKHGLRSGCAPLVIKISARVSDRGLILEVVNSGRLENGADGGTKIGLRNVRERLARLFAENGRFEIAQEDGGLVRARIEIDEAEARA
jgi:two-component system, LytTR family, sensor kinase